MSQIILNNSTYEEIYTLLSNKKIEEALEKLKKLEKNSATLHYLGKSYFLLKDYKKSIEYFNKSLLLLPNSIQTLVDLGACYIKINLIPEASECLEQALILSNFENPDALALFAGILASKEENKDKNLNLAIKYYNLALKLKPNESVIYSGLGACYSDKGDFDLAKTYLFKALSLDDQAVEAYHTLAFIFSSEMNLTKAKASLYLARETEEGKNNANIDYMLSFLELQEYNYDLGWKLHEARLQSAKFSNYNRTIPFWKGEQLHAKKLLIFAEQGLGDTIQFLRYLPLVKERVNKIILQIDSNTYSKWESKEPDSLKPLIEEYCSKYVDKIVLKGFHDEKYKLQIPLMSLPYIFKTNINNIPKPCEFIFKKNDKLFWKINEYDSSLKIGLVWKGSKNHKNDKNRSCPWQFIYKLVKQHSDYNFFSLQLEGNEDLDNSGLNNFHKLNMDLKTITDTATVISCLDLVICVDTMIAHLSATLGIPTWVMHSFSPDWRWGISDKNSIWYPSITFRNYRQPKANDWNFVINEVSQDLSSVLEKNLFALQ